MEVDPADPPPLYRKWKTGLENPEAVGSDALDKILRDLVEHEKPGMARITMAGAGFLTNSSLVRFFEVSTHLIRI